MDTPAPPDCLNERGASFWKAAHENGVAFFDRELDLLLETCRTLDTIDLLSSAIAEDGVMIKGSQGQLVLNSAVAELRQQQASFSRLVAQLNIDGADEGAQLKSPRAASARASSHLRGQSRRLA